MLVLIVAAAAAQTFDLCAGSGLIVEDLVFEFFDPSVATLIEAEYFGDCSASGKVVLPASHVIASDFGEDEALVLTSGSLLLAESTVNSADSSGTGHDEPGIPGDPTTFDAARVDFIIEATRSTVVSFTYVFGSEEYNEFAGGSFNDAFQLLIGVGDALDPASVAGLTNVALVPGTTQEVSINTVNRNVNSQFYRDNDPSDNNFPPYRTAYDGITTVLQTEPFEIVQGIRYRVCLKVADRGDTFYDSAIYLKPSSFTIDASAPCTFGAADGEFEAPLIGGYIGEIPTVGVNCSEYFNEEASYVVVDLLDGTSSYAHVQLRYNASTSSVALFVPGVRAPALTFLRVERDDNYVYLARLRYVDTRDTESIVLAGPTPSTAFFNVTWDVELADRPNVHILMTFGCLDEKGPNAWIDGVAVFQPVPNNGSFALAVETLDQFYADGCLPRTIELAAANDELAELNLTTSNPILQVVASNYQSYVPSDVAFLRYDFGGITMMPFAPINVQCIDAFGGVTPCFDNDDGFYATMLNEMLSTPRSTEAWRSMCDACVANLCIDFCTALFPDDGQTRRRRRLDVVPPPPVALKNRGTFGNDTSRQARRRLSVFSKLALDAYEDSSYNVECDHLTTVTNCGVQFEIAFGKLKLDAVSFVKSGRCTYAFAGTSPTSPADWAANLDRDVAVFAFVLNEIYEDEDLVIRSAAEGGPGLGPSEGFINGAARVHEGFAEYFRTAWAWLQADLFANECGGNNPLTPSSNGPPIFVGHSLGGATATLAALNFGGEAFTYGAPKVFHRTNKVPAMSNVQRLFHSWDIVAGNANLVGIDWMRNFRHNTASSLVITCDQTVGLAAFNSGIVVALFALQSVKAHLYFGTIFFVCVCDPDVGGDERWTVKVAGGDSQASQFASVDYHSMFFYDYFDSPGIEPVEDVASDATLDPICDAVAQAPTMTPVPPPTMPSICEESPPPEDAEPPCPPNLNQILRDPLYRPVKPSSYVTNVPSVDGLSQFCNYDLATGRLVVTGDDASRSFPRQDDPVAPMSEAWCEACPDPLCDQSNPSDDASDWVGPPVGAGRGDPHFESIYGLEFTFNGRGDYLLLNANASVNSVFEVDARLTSWAGAPGVSVMSAVAFSAGSQRLVLNANNDKFDIFVDGQLVDVQDFPLAVGPAISLVNGTLGFLWVTYRAIVSVGVKNVNNTISYAIVTHSNATTFDGGLTYAGDAFDPAQISAAFLQWLKNDTGPIFDVLGPTDIETTSWRALAPDLPIPSFCNGSLQCAFDANATGSAEFAAATATEAFEVAALVQVLSVPTTTCALPKSTPFIVHDVQGVYENDTLTSTCVFAPTFNETRVCLDGAFTPPSVLDCPVSLAPTASPTQPQTDFPSVAQTDSPSVAQTEPPSVAQTEPPTPIEPPTNSPTFTLAPTADSVTDTPSASPNEAMPSSVPTFNTANPTSIF